MKAKTLAVAIASLFAASAMAQEAGTVVNGAVSIGGIASDVRNTKDRSGFEEYRDLRNGGLAGFDIGVRGTRDWLDLFGENLGREDQLIDVRGGRYGVFKYGVYLNDIVHNEGSNLITPFTGVGTNALRAPITGTGTAATFNTNTGTWLPFDLGINRRHTGAFAEWAPAGQPFYGRVDATEQKREGTRIQAAANGTSPGNGFIELPVPIDMTTRVISGEVGYSSKVAHLAVNVSKSKFTNSNEFVTYNNPFFNGGVDTFTLSPDSEQTKWSVNGLIKSLPWDSQLAARYTNSKLTADVPLLQGVLQTGNSSAITPTPANVSTFNGENKVTTTSVAWTARPTKQTDAKLYWNYYKKDNSSDEVLFTAQNITPERFEFTKKNLGAEFWYRFAGHTKGILGYDRAETDRERSDFTKTKDDKLYLEARSDAWDTAALRARYQHLKRRSDFQEADAGVSANDPNFLNRFIARFDVANVDQDLFKVTADFTTPVPMLDVGGEFIVKNNKYKDTTLGRTKDNRQELYLNAGYGDRAAWRVNGFLDFELIHMDSTHRNISTVASGPNPPSGFCTTANPNCFDPINGPSNSGSYNWNGKVKERNFAAGLAGDWIFNERLTFKASYTFQKTEGSVDLSSPLFPAPFVPLVDVANVDDVRINTVWLRGIYKVMPTLDMTLGYSYEDYKYRDTAFDNYANVVAGGNNSQRSYLTGAYSAQGYTANVVYVMFTYRFH